jgi:endonuclease YncB( thermonuclease family)
MTEPVWWSSRCKPSAVHDGDTFHIPWIDTGHAIRVYPLGYDPDDPKQAPGVIAVRLAGCNARELSMPGGPEARAALEQILGGGYVKLETVTADAFGGRVDARPYVPNGTDRGLDVIQALIGQQWLVPWNGRGSKPLPPWPRTVT